jgi:hypothetical protein
MAPIKDYQFCWQLNANTQKNFRANHELEIKLKKKDFIIFLFLNIRNLQNS